MHRIDGDAHVLNRFDEGDPGVPRNPTQITADIMNALQEELVGVVLAPGSAVALSKPDNTQVITTIRNYLNGKTTENFCINGAFDLWQRGTSFTSIGTTRVFGPDRWYGKVSAGASELSISRVTGPDDFRYGLKVQRQSGSTNVNPMYVAQEVDREFVRQMRGRRIYLSCITKNGANFSQAGAPVGRVVYGTGAETETLAGGYTGQTNLLSAGMAGASATYVKSTTHSAGAVLPVTATTMAIQFEMTPVSTAGADDSFTIAAVILAAGPINNVFSRAGGSLEGEIALCQRYYEKSYNLGVNPGTNTGTGSSRLIVSNNGDSGADLRFLVRKRVAPTMTFYRDDGTSGSWNIIGGAGGTTGLSTISGISERNALVDQTGAPDLAAADSFIRGHWTADAEI